MPLRASGRCSRLDPGDLDGPGLELEAPLDDDPLAGGDTLEDGNLFAVGRAGNHLAAIEARGPAPDEDEPPGAVALQRGFRDQDRRLVRAQAHGDVDVHAR